MGIKMTAKKFKGLRGFFLEEREEQMGNKVVRRAKHAVSWMLAEQREVDERWSIESSLIQWR